MSLQEREFVLLCLPFPSWNSFISYALKERNDEKTVGDIELQQSLFSTSRNEPNEAEENVITHDGTNSSLLDLFPC